MDALEERLDWYLPIVAERKATPVQSGSPASSVGERLSPPIGDPNQ